MFARHGAFRPHIVARLLPRFALPKGLPCRRRSLPEAWLDISDVHPPSTTEVVTGSLATECARRNEPVVFGRAPEGSLRILRALIYSS